MNHGQQKEYEEHFSPDGEYIQYQMENPEMHDQPMKSNTIKPSQDKTVEKKIILDLCGGTGSWSAPWKDAGYTVHNITLPEWDVRKHVFMNGGFLVFNPKDPTKESLKINVSDIYGILAAPPCTMFSDARTNARTPRDLRGGMSIVQACSHIIQECQYRTEDDQQKYSPLKFWALENPWYGRLKWFLGNPLFTFSPWEFGDAYKKKTAIWGYFKEPLKTHKTVEEVLTPEQLEKHKTNSQILPKFDYMASKDIHPEHFGKFDRTTRRSITPKGFAQAFFKANQ